MGVGGSLNPTTLMGKQHASKEWEPGVPGMFVGLATEEGTLGCRMRREDPRGDYLNTQESQTKSFSFHVRITNWCRKNLSPRANYPESIHDGAKASRQDPLKSRDLT